MDVVVGCCGRWLFAAARTTRRLLSPPAAGARGLMLGCLFGWVCLYQQSVVDDYVLSVSVVFSLLLERYLLVSFADALYHVVPAHTACIFQTALGSFLHP